MNVTCIVKERQFIQTDIATDTGDGGLFSLQWIKILWPKLIFLCVCVWIKILWPKLIFLWGEGGGGGGAVSIQSTMD